MTIQNIVAAVNTKLAGENLTFNQMRLFLNECVDDMNTALNACFPSFDDYNAGDTYDVIPDRYIRSVLVTGAAYKFYETDEEGIDSAQQYHADYDQNLFYMKRDYSDKVPEEYMSDNTGSVVGPNLDSSITPIWGGFYYGCC